VPEAVDTADVRLEVEDEQAGEGFMLTYEVNCSRTKATYFHIPLRCRQC
jgi:hypothetical protein